ncbi:MAG: lysozyme [Bacteroidales bacterium]|nr:lysozyme [Bacteroidales bacterium]
MKTSIIGRNLIKTFEGYRNTAYLDPVGIWTIGYGHTRGVKEGDTVTEEEADILLQSDLKAAENTVNATGLKLSQLQFDALVSLVYNIGSGKFNSSTLLKQLRESTKPRPELETWWKVWDKARGKTLKGLQRRREAEYLLYSKGFFLLAAVIVLLVAAVLLTINIITR